MTFQAIGGTAELFRATDRELLVFGPAGTGKSRGVLEKLVYLCEEHSGIRVLIARRERADLTETTLVTLESQVLPPGHTALRGGGDRKWRTRYDFANGSSIVVAGLTDSGNKILSAEYDVIFVDEATQITEHQWEQLLSRLRHFKLQFQQAISCCNPDSPYHWLYRRAKSGRMKEIQSRYQDNPKYWDYTKGDWTPLGKDYVINTLGASLTGFRRKRLFEGVWCAAEGLIYEGFQREIHVIAPFNTVAREYRHFAANDFGYRHTGVIQVFALDENGNLYMVDEIYRPGKTIDWWIGEAKRLNDKYNIEYFVCDSARPDSIEQMAQAGLVCRKATKDVSLGIQKVEQRLQDKKLFFFADARKHAADASLVSAKRPTCTIEEFDSYVRKQDKSGRTLEEPVKVNDDGLDSLRYAIMSIDGKQPCGYIGVVGELTEEETPQPEMVEYEIDLSEVN